MTSSNQGGDRTEASGSALPDALACFSEIAGRLAGRRLAVFLDYDGTLTPIVARPELALLEEATRSAIRELAARVRVAIVSGRDRADVERMVGIDDLIYAGSHGLDIAGPRLQDQYEGAEAFLPALARAEAALRARLAGVEGALVERKRYAIAVHHRLVPEAQVPMLEAAVDAAIVQAQGELRKTGGKKIFELRPQLAWDKGRAVLWLLRVLGLDEADVLPLYIGDDETDEDAFRALRDRGGLGVLVASAPQPTAAHYRLSDPSATASFLCALLRLQNEPERPPDALTSRGSVRSDR